MAQIFSIQRTSGGTAVFGQQVSAAGAIGIALAAGALALGGYAPTVTQSVNLTAQPGVGSLTVTGSAPTVAQSASVAVQPSFAPLAVVGLAPTVGQTVAQGASPGAAALSMVCFAPTVAQTLSQAVVPDALALSFLTFALTVTNSAAVPFGSAYVTLQQLIDRFGVDELVQVSNRTDPSAQAINATRVAQAAADVTALIDAKLGARYNVPLVRVPLLIVNLACDLVRARLYDDRIPDRLADREKAALKLLDQISDGSLTLGLDATAQATPPSDGPQYFSGSAVFTQDTLRDFAP